MESLYLAQREDNSLVYSFQPYVSLLGLSDSDD